MWRVRAAPRRLPGAPCRSGNRDRAASGAQPRIGFKRGRSDEEGDGEGSGGGASLLASGLGDPAAMVGNSAKRRALASRLSHGERRTWRAGATPHAGARMLPALPGPERAPQQAASDAAGGSAGTPGAHAAKLNSSAARRILMSLQSVDLVRSLPAFSALVNVASTHTLLWSRYCTCWLADPRGRKAMHKRTPSCAQLFAIQHADGSGLLLRRQCRAPMSTRHTTSRRRCQRRQGTALASRRLQSAGLRAQVIPAC